MEKKIKKNTVSTTAGTDNQIIAQKSASFLPIIAANLDKLLETKKISAKELHLQTGYSEAAISKYRTGKQTPSVEFLLELKKLYDISIDDFLSKNITKGDFYSQMPQSAVEQAEETLYLKFCGTYLVYYLNSSNYKGRDQNSPEDALLYGVLSISADKTALNKPHYNCIAVLGIKERAVATDLKWIIDKMGSYSDIERYISINRTEELSKKTYYGNFELSAEHAFITLAHDRKDKALVILHRVNSNKKEYIGGMGTINSVSKGREPTPTAQYIALTRYPISLSAEEIHHQLLLGHPTYKADDNAKELIALFKKTYMMPDPDGEIHTELEKELIIKVNLERYVKNSLINNMFRYAKISERDDGSWYDLLKEVSIREKHATDNLTKN